MGFVVPVAFWGVLMGAQQQGVFGRCHKHPPALGLHLHLVPEAKDLS